MSAIQEAKIQTPVFSNRVPQRPVESRLESAAPAHRAEVSGGEAVQLSSRASEINASDRLGAFWSGVLQGDKPVDGAQRFRSETKQPLEGYDQAKLDDPKEQTSKYIFGRVAQNFKLDSVEVDKTKAEDLLNAMIPELQKAGLEVVAVSGDKIQVKTEVGYEWVDVIRGAGAAKPAWQWGSEGAGTAQPTKTVQEWEAKTGVGAVAAAAAAGGASAPHGPIVLGKQIDGNKVLSILRKYEPNGQGLTKAAKDGQLQQLYPGVMTYGGHDRDGKAFDAQSRLDQGLNVDKLYFPNGAIVDVIKGAGAAGADWGWMPEN
jgi:hypothetical protein